MKTKLQSNRRKKERNIFPLADMRLQRRFLSLTICQKLLQKFDCRFESIKIFSFSFFLFFQIEYFHRSPIQLDEIGKLSNREGKNRSSPTVRIHSTRPMAAGFRWRFEAERARVSSGIIGIPRPVASCRVADSRLTSFARLTKRRDPVVDSRLET